MGTRAFHRCDLVLKVDGDFAFSRIEIRLIMVIVNQSGQTLLDTSVVSWMCMLPYRKRYITQLVRNVPMTTRDQGEVVHWLPSTSAMLMLVGNICWKDTLSVRQEHSSGFAFNEIRKAWHFRPGMRLTALIGIPTSSEKPAPNGIPPHGR